jgi:diguanylate cyclase (GGDEF)-like protein
MTEHLAPHLALHKGHVSAFSRQLLGFSCRSGEAVIQATQTDMLALPMPVSSALESQWGYGLRLYVAVKEGRRPVWYYETHINKGKFEFLPSSRASWTAVALATSAEKDDSAVRGERFFLRIVDPLNNLEIIVNSDPLLPNYLNLFVRNNCLEIILLGGLLICLLLTGWLVEQLVNSSMGYYQAATHDYLTKLYNRRAAMELAEAELARARRNGTPLVVMQLDIDHFKRVNDTYGHDGGDQVLQFLSRQLQHVMRQQDMAARIGGEEFLIMLPNTDLAGAEVLAERLLQGLRKARLDYTGQSIGITCSIGITAWRGPADSLEALLIRGDRLLYLAKQQGRDRYVSDAAEQAIEQTAALN